MEPHPYSDEIYEEHPELYDLPQDEYRKLTRGITEDLYPVLPLEDYPKRPAEKVIYARPKRAV